jgi:hypothetical protein
VVSVGEKVAPDAIRYGFGSRTQVNHCRCVVNLLGNAKTGEFSLPRDQCGQRLLMGRMAFGIEVA